MDEFLDKVTILKGRHIRQRLEQLPEPDDIQEMEMAATPSNIRIGISHNFVKSNFSSIEHKKLIVRQPVQCLSHTSSRSGTVILTTLYLQIL